MSNKYRPYKTIIGSNYELKQDRQGKLTEYVPKTVPKSLQDRAVRDISTALLLPKFIEFKKNGDATKPMRRPSNVANLKKDFEKLNPNILNSMNQLWENYISKIYIPEKGLDSITKCEIQGARLRVFQSKNPNLFGAEGICVFESKNTIVLASQTTPVKIHIIQKNKSNFHMFYQNTRFTLFGAAWCFRPAERMIKSLKINPTITL
ncbi:hypothetical protein EIN_080910 [Entamoeba invadens IP1]|uniref:hypothetical protein n=1 Tax=Entamoeba invadens IP1 TaxID=370355 RepID=UPI0002C3EC49|nr:hypothetical protein EIN_080910 [Entamoeba invadens IP1]ELP85119.1 hypothetical protein EIN_080910 [Entamoeba invadens IP1]|eukprot:XP_004184465.1 hypothetical protein EIN_080910 [Entamoeba invadens IP1]